MTNYLKKYPFISIVIFYLLGNFTLLINNGVYWDDWTIYNSTYEAIMVQFNGNGSPIMGRLHLFLFQSKYAVLIYHLLTVILQILTGYFLWKSLKSLKVDLDFSYWVVLFATIIPFFAAKNTLICFPYTVTYFLFILAIFLMIKAIKTNNLFIRIIALFLFFGSFLTNSLVVFYIAPYVLLYFLVSKQQINNTLLNFKSTIKHFKFSYILRTIDFLALPFAFFIVKLLFLKTSNLYAASGYNELSFAKIAIVPKHLIKTIRESFFGLFSHSITASYNLLFLFIVYSFIIYYFINAIKFKNTIKQSNFNLYLKIGAILFVIAAIPYNLVGKIPAFIAYDTRHQLLLPIGTSLIIVTLIYKIFNPKYVKPILTGFTTMFIVFALSQNFQFIKGWLKQESIYENIKNNATIINNSSFIVLDHTPELNATSRDNAFYNLSGIAKKSFGDQKRLLCEFDEYFSLISEWPMLLKESEKFNLKDYTISNPNYIIVINKGSVNLTNLNTLKIIFLNVFNKQKYQNTIKNILTIKVAKKDLNTIKFFLDTK